MEAHRSVPCIRHVGGVLRKRIIFIKVVCHSSRRQAFVHDPSRDAAAAPRSDLAQARVGRGWPRGRVQEPVVGTGVEKLPLKREA